MTQKFIETIAGKTVDIDLSKTSVKTENLVVLCTDIFLIIIRMRESADLGEPAALRKLILHYIDLFKKNCRALKIDPSSINDAVYALVAYLDETVMSVPGECCNYWLHNPIQLELFGDALAGEEFYRKLEKLVQEPQKSKDVLEIYYLCLALGYEGKYRLMNMEEREIIIEKIAKLLLRIGKHTFSTLSPHGIRFVSSGSSRMSLLIPLWIISLVTISLVLFWYFSVRLLVVDTVKQILSVL